MTTIARTMELISAKMHEEFVSLTIKGCWFSMFRTENGEHGINIHMEITDVKYEYNVEHGRYTEYNVIKALDGSYDFEYEKLIDPEMDIETWLEKNIWLMCSDFKVEHKDD